MSGCDVGASPKRERNAFNPNLQAASADAHATLVSPGDLIPFLFVFCLVAFIFLTQRSHRRGIWRTRRRRFIATYVFPPEVLDALHGTWPGLRDWQLAMIQRALRSYFIAHIDAGPDKVLAMPSEAADALWHAFILDTRAYHAFCEDAFGRYFHHLPEYRMADGPASRSASATDALWRSTCDQAGIDPGRADRLPILFELDRLLRLPDAPRPDPAALSRGYRERRSRVDIAFDLGGSGCSSGWAEDAGGADGCDAGDGGCGGGCGGD
jgi:hypothetical protein